MHFLRPPFDLTEVQVCQSALLVHCAVYRCVDSKGAVVQLSTLYKHPVFFLVIVNI